MPGFGGVVFRRTSPELTGPGSVWEEGKSIYPAFGVMRESPNLEVRFKAGGILQFLHLQHESDKLAHQSKGYLLICFDELTHFEESQFWYMLSRNRSVTGQRPYVRATCNPDPDSFVRGLIDWWVGADGYPIAERDGVLRWFIRDGNSLVWADTRDELLPKCRHGQEPLSLTFIRSRLSDNPALTSKDPGYRARIESLPEVERLRLGGGNWNVRPEGGRYVKQEFFARRWAGCTGRLCKLNHTHTLPPLNIYSASDFAVSEKIAGRDPDFTEHGVFGISPDDDLYVLDWWYGQTLSDEWIEQLINLWHKWRPQCAFGESGVIAKAIAPPLAKRMRERRVNCRVEWLPTSSGSQAQSKTAGVGYDDPSKRAKAIRGRAFQARAAMGKIVFPEDSHAPWVARVVSQCVGFPNGKDDAFDVISHMALAIGQAHPAIIPTKPRELKRHDYSSKAPSADGWKTV